MICPSCNNDIQSASEVCPDCGYVLVERRREQADQRHNVLNMGVILNAFVRLLLLIFSIAFFSYVLYVGYFWFDSWRTDRIYEQGGAIRKPEVEAEVLDDGRVGHVFTFYGTDGDELFVPELNHSYMFVGGITQINIPDSSWFSASPDGDEAAEIVLTPIIHTQKNSHIQLPPLEMTIETPESPLELIQPKTDYETVITSIYTLKLKVVVGSKVLINGVDQTDVVNYDGVLESNINVDPIGDNVISINVATPNHKQIRRDIVLHRPEQSIKLEPDLNMTKSTVRSTVKVSGMTEPGAMIIIDSKYVEGSLSVKDTGAFEFRANLPIIGDNLITFHATMEGRDDTTIAVPVYHVPSLDEYSRSAWVMDYVELCKMTDIWAGQEFLCKGPVIEVFESEDGEQCIAMNVAAEGASERQIVVLVNKSSVTAPNVGQTYRAYADVVEEMVFYGDSRCPKLMARYILE